MLEEKLQSLENAVTELDASIKSLTAEMGVQAGAATEDAPAEKPAAKSKAASKSKAKPAAKSEPAETEPEEPVTEQAPDEPEDWGDDFDEADENTPPMTLDEFRAAVLPLGKEHGPKLIKGAGYSKMSDVPEKERAALAAEAKKIKAQLPAG